LAIIKNFEISFDDARRDKQREKTECYGKYKSLILQENDPFSPLFGKLKTLCIIPLLF